MSQELSKGNQNPFYNLFIWAVLTNNFELSKLFLKHSNESSIAACLFASAVLTKCASEAVNQGQAKIQQSAEAYKQLSIDLLQQCYSSDPEKTHDILCMVRPEWGNTSCMFVAARSENKLFIADQACQDLITKVWEGKYPREDSKFTLATCSNSQRPDACNGTIDDSCL
ncbi:transient receptor potential cation channel subfamily M member 5-like [Physella acuta]|uniref:transient receptor potential cation channel subfamily M member 5-like n=1 Tax=Physella acuta TaxID=109671 RepID=UPI0027DBE02E|nr:transient receptor potential cation channel subfamily M member 5-like [Physella acuta]